MPEITDFADIYQEIARETNPETAAQIHRLFKGQQIIFPKKLYNREYIYRYHIQKCSTQLVPAAE